MLIPSAMKLACGLLDAIQKANICKQSVNATHVSAQNSTKASMPGDKGKLTCIITRPPDSILLQEWPVILDNGPYEMVKTNNSRETCPEQGRDAISNNHGRDIRGSTCGQLKDVHEQRSMDEKRRAVVEDGY